MLVCDANWAVVTRQGDVFVQYNQTVDVSDLAVLEPVVLPCSLRELSEQHPDGAMLVWKNDHMIGTYALTDALLATFVPEGTPPFSSAHADRDVVLIGKDAPRFLCLDSCDTVETPSQMFSVPQGLRSFGYEDRTQVFCIKQDAAMVRGLDTVACRNRLDGRPSWVSPYGPRRHAR